MEVGISERDLIDIREASRWASEFLRREVTESNIAYLINYGRVSKRVVNGRVYVSLEELRRYYEEATLKKEREFRKKLGDDINWELSFDWVPERERTKHVHRLHPYKGKFIPQLVEYFLNRYFKKGDIVLDPFVGSGTTLIQANEMGIHSIGIDISEFNTIITEVKFANVNLIELQRTINEILKALKTYENNSQIVEFERELKDRLSEFNNRHFPSPEFKNRFRQGLVPEDYLIERQREFLEIYESLIDKYNIPLNTGGGQTFLDRWYIPTVREEALSILEIISGVQDENLRKTLMLILSRTIRSVRATTHMDLDRLKEPQYTPYYCYKHFKICKPVFSLIPTFKKYAKDTVRRLSEYKRLKTQAFQEVLTGDSREINIYDELRKRNEGFYKLLKERQITGIFTSPPYVGQIDYHEQHAYAYELFGIDRRDELEIGPLYKGKGKEARASYIKGISQVLKNCLNYMIKNPTIIIVANDEYKLYPEIAKEVGLEIVEEFKRPVLNRTARDKNAYYESVFVMRR